MKKDKTIFEKIEEGIQLAAAKAIARHKALGESIAVWRDGKVVIVPAKDIKVPKIKSDK